MPSVDYQNVRLGCRATLKDVVDLPYIIPENHSTPITAVKGQTPPSSPDSLFLKETILKSLAPRSSMEHIEAHPIVVYAVHVPAGRGTEVAESLAKRINDAFIPNSVVQYGGYNMVIERSYQGSPYEENEGRRTKGDALWYVCPVFIELRVFVSSPL